MKNSGEIIYKNKIVIKPKEADGNIDGKKDIDVKPLDTNDSISKYIQQLNPLQLVAYEIAKSRLKTSFDIEKSIGFKTFIN